MTGIYIIAHKEKYLYVAGSGITNQIDEATRFVNCWHAGDTRNQLEHPEDWQVRVIPYWKQEETPPCQEDETGVG